MQENLYKILDVNYFQNTKGKYITIRKTLILRIVMGI